LALSLNERNERDCLVELLQLLGANRARQSGKLHQLVRAIGARLHRRLGKCESRLEKILQENRNGSSGPIPTDITAKVISLSEKLKFPKRLNRQNLHPYRLKVKELRNMLQLGKEAKRRQLVTRLGEVKDAIGEWHDWQELTTIAKENLTHAPRCKLIKRLRTKSDEKYQKAFSLTQDMKTSMFAASLSQSARAKKSKTTTLRPQALAAVTAMN
jgi:CHAD domain-containing protein